MVKVRAVAVRRHSDDFPGWLEVSVRDARGQDHRIVDKLPVLTPLAITADSPFPMELWLEAEADEAGGDLVSVTLAHGVETVGGAKR
jgi:hypothetical protein